MSSPCQICHHDGPMRPFYPALSIVQCPECKLVFFAGDAGDVATLYAEGYFKGEEYTDYVADQDTIQLNFRRRIDDLRRLAPSGKLLELGSAYGFFLELAREHWDVRGLDITPEGVAYARDQLGLNVQQADFLTLPDEPEAYDLICMWDTIEHLPQPARFIEKAAKWLKPGGSLVITTGDVSSLVSRVRKERWRLVHPPTHLYYFSPATLGRAMTQAGLKVSDVKHVGYARSLRQMAHGVLAANGKPTAWLYDGLVRHVTPDVPVYMNLFDIMMVTATKPPTGAQAP